MIYQRAHWLLCRPRFSRPCCHVRAAALSRTTGKRGPMARRRLCVGVDGGATKTDCSIIDLESNQVTTVSVNGSCNRNSVGNTEALSNLVGSIEDALQAADAAWEDVEAICAAISGIDTNDDLTDYRQSIGSGLFEGRTRPEVPVYLCNDAVAALAAGTGGLPCGVVLIAGTGVVAFGAWRSRCVRAGGWGPLFRDGGCGYDLGQRAVQAAAKAVDGRGGPTLLADAIPQLLGFDDMLLAMRWLYQDASWARIAGIAPAVVQCAAENDPESCRILGEAAAELTAAVHAVVDRLCVDAGEPLPPIVLSGGLLCNRTLYSDLVVRSISNELPGHAVVRTSANASIGAAQLAAHYLNAQCTDDSVDVLRGTMCPHEQTPVGGDLATLGRGSGQSQGGGIAPAGTMVNREDRPPHVPNAAATEEPAALGLR